MNKTFKLLIAIGLNIVLFNLIPSVVLAQIVSQSQRQINDTNIDDLPNLPQELRFWRCSAEDKAITVEAKDTSVWQEIIETNGWQCSEQLSVIADNENQFSCEPTESNLDAIITTTWLEGKGGEQQMQSWMNAFQSKGMTCTTESSNLE